MTDEDAGELRLTPDEWIVELVRRADGDPTRAHETALAWVQAGLAAVGFQFYVVILSNLSGAKPPAMADELTSEFLQEAQSGVHLDQLIRERTDERENPSLVSEVREQTKVAALTAVVEAVNREIEHYRQQRGGTSSPMIAAIYARNRARM